VAALVIVISVSLIMSRRNANIVCTVRSVRRLRDPHLASCPWDHPLIEMILSKSERSKKGIILPIVDMARILSGIGKGNELLHSSGHQRHGYIDNNVT
jgi:hypothetical protein